MSTGKLKCGIVGYGYMGEIRRRVVEEHPRLELYGICDANRERRELIENCRIFDSWGELLRTPIDIVFVCTPNRFSPEICVSGLRAGKHVFCEKPPGRDAAELKEIIDTEREPLKLMFGFNHRFHPGIIHAKTIVESGRLGSIIGLRGLYGKSGGVNFRNSWRNDRSVSGGGILLDQGIHMLDLFCYFCGSFEQVKCFVSNSFWKLDTEDNAYVILQNARGQNASLHSSATLWKHTFRLDLILEGGYITVEGLLSKTGSYGREKVIVGKRQFEDEALAVGNPSEEITYFDRDESWSREVDEFVKCIDNDLPITSGSSMDAAAVMEIIEKAYKDANVASLYKDHEAYRYI